jgi:hypothetical protein
MGFIGIRVVDRLFAAVIDAPVFPCGRGDGAPEGRDVAIAGRSAVNIRLVGERFFALFIVVFGQSQLFVAMKRRRTNGGKGEAHQAAR